MLANETIVKCFCSCFILF